MIKRFLASVMVIAFCALGVVVEKEKVEAVAESVINVTADYHATLQQYEGSYGNSNTSWYTIRSYTGSGSTDETTCYGGVYVDTWNNDEGRYDYQILKRGYLHWNLTGISTTLNVTKIEVVATPSINGTANFTDTDNEESITLGAALPVGAFTPVTSAGDFGGCYWYAGSGLGITGFSQNNQVETTFTFTTTGLNWFDNFRAQYPNDFCLSVLTGFDALGSSPSPVAVGMQFIAGLTVTSHPVLKIYYTGTPNSGGPSIGGTDNDPDHPGLGGDITGVTWESPKCAWADETMYWDIAGDSGTALTYTVVSEDAAVLKTATDEIRENGHLYVNYDIGTYRGFLKLKVEGNGETLYSDWGYVESNPSASMGTNELSMLRTGSLDGYTADDYVIRDGSQILKLYFKTNVTEAEMTDYGVSLWYQCSDSSNLIPYTFAELADNYYEITKSTNRPYSVYRYMLVRLNAADDDEDYDGLVLDVDAGEISDYGGLYVPVMYVVSSGLQEASSETVSGVWYATKNPVPWTISTNKVNAQQNVNVTAMFNEETFQNLVFSQFNVQIEQSGSVLSSYLNLVNDELTVINGFKSPATAGQYTIRVVFYNDVFEWTETTLLTVGGGGTVPPDQPGGGGGWWDWIDEVDSTMVRMGLVFLFGIMGAVVPRENWLKIVLVTLVLGVSVIIGWVAWWVWILIALVVGIFIMKTFMGHKE